MFMTADEVVTEMTMSYSHVMHLVVEGETDQKFFISVLQNQPCVNVVCATGSDGVINVIELIEKDNINKKSVVPTLGVIDRDYRIPRGDVPLSSNILLTDLRDLECMMIGSPSLGYVLNELGSVKKIKKFGSEAAILTKIIDACKVVGELRYFSQSTKMNLTFQNLDYEKFVDKKSLTLNPKQLADHISGAQPSGATRITVATLATANLACKKATVLNGGKYFTHDLLICRGHDLTSLIAIGLRSLWGSRQASESTSSMIEGYLRVAYLTHFKNSALYTSMASWIALRNIHHKVMI